MTITNTSEQVLSRSTNAVLEHHIHEAHAALLKLRAVVGEETADRPHEPVGIIALTRARELAPLAYACEQLLHRLE